MKRSHWGSHSFLHKYHLFPSTMNLPVVLMLPLSWWSELISFLSTRLCLTVVAGWLKCMVCLRHEVNAVANLSVNVDFKPRLAYFAQIMFFFGTLWTASVLRECQQFLSIFLSKMVHLVLLSWFHACICWAVIMCQLYFHLKVWTWLCFEMGVWLHGCVGGPLQSVTGLMAYHRYVFGSMPVL